MGNTNSLTHQVQIELEDIQKELIKAGNMEFEKLESDIRCFLRKPESISTFGFQVRRHIQVNFQEFFMEENKYEFMAGKDYPDLLNGGNRPWPENVVEMIAKRLAKYYGTANGSLGKKEIWKDYLTDQSVPNDRESVFRIAFTLKMGVEATILLFMSVGMEAYNMRNPQDFIFYFCARRSERVKFNEASYNWKAASDLWNRYIEEVYKPSINIISNREAIKGTEGYTMLLRNSLEDLINSTEPAKIVEDKLFKYLISAKGEFVSCTKKVSGRRKTYVPEAAYSYSNYENFMRLTRYLYILYPSIPQITEENISDEEHTYSKNKEEKIDETDQYSIHKERPVRVVSAGFPVLGDLVEAMMFTNLDMFTSQTNDEYVTDIVESIRLLKEKYEDIKEKHVITRGELMIVVYFFLLEYYNPCITTKDKLIELAEEGKYAIDKALLTMMDVVYEDIDGYNDKARVKLVIQDINYFLKVFHFPEIYLPNKIDRFVISTLLPARPVDESVDESVDEPLDVLREIIKDMLNMGSKDDFFLQIEEWQNRTFDEIYPILYIDTIYYLVRDKGNVCKHAADVIFGINAKGKKEVLTITVRNNENENYWHSVMNELKNRGVKDILIICADGVIGIKDAITSVFPNAEYQRSIAHQVRNTLKYIPSKDRKAFATDLKTIYLASTEEQAKVALDCMNDTWAPKFPNHMKCWYNNWDVITPIFKFSENVRKVICTTNIIGSLNSTYRKLDLKRSVFTRDVYLLKDLYMAAFEATKEWTNAVKNWGKVYEELSIMYESRSAVKNK